MGTCGWRPDSLAFIIPLSHGTFIFRVLLRYRREMTGAMWFE